MRRIGALLVGAVVLMMAGTSVSDARPPGDAFPGTPGDIAFTSSQTGNSQIFLLHANGSETNLSASATNDRDPAWSPAGTRIAFTRGNNIWVMNADGSDQVDLTNSPNSNGGPAWSPDGSKIAFVSDRDVTSTEIYVMNANGSHVQRLTTNTLSEHDLAWAPNGKTIAFDANNGSNSEIYTISAKDGSGLTDLSNNNAPDQYPDWSPDGSLLAFTSARAGSPNLYVMNPDGSGQAALGTPNLYAAAAGPAWSPDGSRLVYAANWGLGSEQLWVVAANGSDYGATGTKLTSDPGNPLNTQPDWQPVHVVTVTAQPSSGAAGSTTTVSGTGFLARDKVKLVFRDANGVKTLLGTAVASAAGAISFPTAVPTGAALGKAHITATAKSGLSQKLTFTVTA
jgi:Tol biopolymer transport system component